MDNLVTIRDITQSDIKAFFPSGLRDSCIGWAISLNGNLAAVAGVSFSRGVYVAFSRIKNGLVVSKRLIWESALKVNALVTGLPYETIYALTTNGRFLQALGWKFVEYRGHVEVFQWTR